jgi:hypothetical protein
MRRALVLTNESSRNPFRQYFRWTPEPGSSEERAIKAQSSLRFFGTSYTGFFILLYGMML